MKSRPVPNVPPDALHSDMALFEWTLALLLGMNRLREEGAIGDEAFHRLEEELDWAELDAAPAGSFQPLLTDGAAPGPRM